MVSAWEGVDKRAARAVGSVVLFDAQGTLFTQRASLAFGEDLGRTSSPERRPCERSKVGHGPPDRPTGRNGVWGSTSRLQFSTRQKVLPGFICN